MKIATWNVNSLNVRLPHLQAWSELAKPDIIALQETKVDDMAFPLDAIHALGYQCIFSGQKSYNGVAILARDSLFSANLAEAFVDVVTEVPGLDDPSRRVLAASVDDLRIINLYVVNGQAVGSEKYQHKLFWLEKVTQFIASELLKYPNLVVMGDFNITMDDRDVHDPLQWHEQILCSTPERAALKKMLALGLHDSYRMFDQSSGIFSWWDYRQAGFRRNLGLRIDFVLVSEALKTRCSVAGIDKEPRQWERPSDHAPVWMILS